MLEEIYYEVDEFNQIYLEKIASFASSISWYPKRKLGCMSMSEIMTILIFYHHSHYKNFKHYYQQYVGKDLKKDFPILVNYDRFIWYIPMAFLPMMCFHLFRCKLSIRTNNYFIDSTKIVACHPKRVHQNAVFKGIASWGKTSTGWFYGIKIHLIINNLGEIIQTCFTTGSTSDTNIGVLFYLLKDLSGWVFGDKGYLMNQAKMDFVEYEGTLDFFAKPRNNTKKANRKSIPDEAKKMAKKRPIIETVIGLQKGVLDLEHTRHRSALNAFTHMLAAMCAYSFYQRKPKGSIQTHKALKQYNSLIAA
jgi:hypothetical protein